MGLIDSGAMDFFIILLVLFFGMNTIISVLMYRKYHQIKEDIDLIANFIMNEYKIK